MSERQQMIQIGQKFLDVENISLGVAQGSIGGPLLFNIFIDDLFEVPEHGRLTLFVDITAFFVSDSPQEVEQIIKNGLKRLSNWCRVNGLSVNRSKTDVIAEKCCVLSMNNGGF